MRNSVLHPVLLVSLLGCTVLAGCHHADHACPTCGGQRVAMTPAQNPQLVLAPAPVSPYAPVASGPIVHEVLKSTPTNESPLQDNHEWQSVSGIVREKMMSRRTFTDLTANPAFAHAPDYTWLVGELRAIGTDVWTVRFASVDEERDTVLLVDAPSMVNLKSGQLVRVEGQLVDPTSHDGRPAYRVGSIHAVEHEQN